MKTYVTLAIALAAGVAIAGCVVHNTDRPELTGPSGLANTITLTASPDTITQNGTSTSTITVTAIGPTGQPLANVPVRIDTLVGGLVTDFGTLSARQVTTNSNGQATVTFTSPPAPPNGAISGTCGVFGTPTFNGPCVTIGATPIGTNFTNAVTSTVDIHLLPVEIIRTPGSPIPAFTVSGDFKAGGNDNILFSAAGSTAAAGRTIVDYQWDFGDGTHLKFGVNTTHDYSAPGQYLVTLTVTDDAGNKASASKIITITS
jgi:PKD repeat protein